MPLWPCHKQTSLHSTGKKVTLSGILRCEGKYPGTSAPITICAKQKMIDDKNLWEAIRFRKTPAFPLSRILWKHGMDDWQLKYVSECCLCCSEEKATEAGTITSRFEKNTMHLTFRLELVEQGEIRCLSSHGNQRFPFKMMSELSIEIPFMEICTSYCAKN